MSGRGRGGRGGRGGGRGGGPQSVSQQYLMNAATEAGIDVRNMRGLPGGAGGTCGRIFPDLELHSGGERRLHPHEVDGGGGGGGGVGTGGGSGDASSSAAAAAGDDGDGASPSAASASVGGDAFLISKMREMHHRLRTSAFHVRPSGEGVPDVERYAPPSNSNSTAQTSRRPPSSSDVDCRRRPPPPGDVVVGARKRTRGEGGGAYVPEELCGAGAVRRGCGGGPSGRGAKLRALDLAELAAKIRSDGVAGGAGGGGGGADGGVLDEDGNRRRQEGEGGEEEGDEYAQEDEEESDGADYAANYYESEGDESKGSDGEPTF